MKRTLVNHDGIVQWKFIISTDEELVQYAKHQSTVLSEELRQIISSKSNDSETNTQKALRLTSEIHRVPLIVSGDVILHKVIMAMHTFILKGQTIVVNEAGGYCPWDDSCMSLVDESEALESSADMKNQIVSDLTAGPILVLENQGDIPEEVRKYIDYTFDTLNFSYIRNIQFNKDRLVPLLTDALKAKHDTIVVLSTLMDKSQIILMVEFLEKIPFKINFHISTSVNLKDSLNKSFGINRVEALFQRHNIVQW